MFKAGVPGLNWAVTGGECPLGVDEARELDGVNPDERVALADSAAPAAAAFFKASAVLLLLLSISLQMARPILSCKQE